MPKGKTANFLSEART